MISCILHFLSFSHLHFPPFDQRAAPETILQHRGITVANYLLISLPKSYHYNTKLVQKQMPPTPPAPPQLSKEAGTRLGQVLCGHGLFIKGQPSVFHRDLAPHFIVVEGMTLAPAAALIATHTLTSWHVKPQASQVSQMCREYAHRHEAMTLWTQNFTNDRADIKNGGYRFLAFAGAWTTLAPWVVVSALSPATTHYALKEANRILAMKYSTISAGMPAELKEKIAIYESYEAFHDQASQTERTQFLVVSLVLLWVFLPSLLNQYQTARQSMAQPPPGTAGWAQNYNPPRM